MIPRTSECGFGDRSAEAENRAGYPPSPEPPGISMASTTATSPSRQQRGPLASPAEDGRPVVEVLRRLIERDLLVQLTLAAFLAALLPSLLPLFDQDQRQALNTNIFRVLQLLAFCALRLDLRKLDRLERAFWNDLGIVYGCWLLVTALYALSPEPTGARSMTFYLSAEVLLALGYGAWVLAAERQPHRRHRLRAVGLERSLSWPAATAFVGGLMAYFILVPAFLDRKEYESFLPSMLLYVSLDIYLVTRFGYLARDTTSPRWRLIYGGLALTAAGMLIADSMEASTYFFPAFEWSSALDPLYALQLIAVVLTARLRHLDLPLEPPASTSATPYTDWRMGPTLPTLITALVIPLLHFACYAGGLLEESSKEVRQILVMVWIGLLGFIAAVQHALLSKRAQQLWHDWRRAEKALRRSEQKARVMAERTKTRETLRRSEESFRLALQAAPSPLAIVTRSDGRFREVNYAFLELTGYRRQELVGRTPAQLHLWQRPRDAVHVRRGLRDRPTTLRREIVVRTRRGALRRARLTAESLLFQGAPSLIVTLREPPREMQDLADLAVGRPWIDHLAARLELADEPPPTTEGGDFVSRCFLSDEKDGTWVLDWSRDEPEDEASGNTT